MGKDNGNETKRILIAAECCDTVSYAMIPGGESPFHRLYVKNNTDEDIKDVTVTVTSRPEFILPVTFDQPLLPRRSTLNFEAGIRLSPLFLVGQDQRAEGEIFVEIRSGKSLLNEATFPVAVLGFDECDYRARPVNLAYFVRRTAEVNLIRNEADRRMAEWKLPPFGGYPKSGKNDVRYFFAAAYAVLTEKGFIRTAENAESAYIASHKTLLVGKNASFVELTLLFAAVLEAAGINAVFGKRGEDWYIGAFLTDECFPNVLIDDAAALEKRMEKGVREISMVSVGGIFAGMSFEGNENRTISELKKAPLDFAIDLKRARIMRMRPCPERVKTGKGYNVVESSDFDNSAAPQKIQELTGDFSGDKNLTREKQWERRLLELDMKNPLLNFRVNAYTVKIATANLSDFIGHSFDGGEFEIASLPVTERGAEELSAPFAKASQLRPLAEYLRYEYQAKHLMTLCEGKEYDKNLLALYRRDKLRQEETGTNTLYLAAGFLKYFVPGDAEAKYAPLLLFPVAMRRRGMAKPRYFLTLDTDDVQVNNALLEYLYIQYNIDVRGLGDLALGSFENLAAVIDRLKKETVSQKRWDVYDSVYLCSLSFSNYLMWKEVRTRPEKLKESLLIRSLVANRSEFTAERMAEYSSDEAYEGEDRILLPISADSSQFSAIKDSLTKSFVLHGPPGTGKSQTITNIIVNNIVRGQRVLFVAEKAAALEVVNKRLKDIGAGAFCLELYSDKAQKTEVVSKVADTFRMAGSAEGKRGEEPPEELSLLMEKLGGELEALHKKQRLGFSVYEGILGYLENKDAPDCLRIDPIFYEKLTEESFNRYLALLTELTVRAKECGNIEKSPFRRVGRIPYGEKWRIRGENALGVLQRELRRLREYAKDLVSVFNMRTVSLTARKLKSLYEACMLLEIPAVGTYLSNAGDSAYGVIEGYFRLLESKKRLEEDFTRRYRALPARENYPEILAARDSERARARISRRIAAQTRFELEKTDREAYFAALRRLAETAEAFDKRLAEAALLVGVPAEERKVTEAADAVRRLRACAAVLYVDPDYGVYRESCRFILENAPYLPVVFYRKAYENAAQAEEEFRSVFAIAEEEDESEDIVKRMESLSNLGRNMDYVGSWSKYQEIVEECRENGFDFVLEPLREGEITAEDILSCFKKCVYYNFAKNEISLSDRLCRFSGLELEEATERFRALTEEYERLSRAEIVRRLIENLPGAEEEGEHNLEKVVLYRAEKNAVKGVSLRNLFDQIPHILARACPCMLMSPASVTQYLDLDKHKFDLVVFDEASQIPTCKAVGAIARADRVIVVGDPKQLPPTTFFGVEFKDEENLDVEDLDSVLDDCLAIGMPERHLLWHYRSHHESLIAFSNAMFYDNALFTFPSPSELDSKVTLRYVDGYYDRGGTKVNQKEAEELIAEVIGRLSSPVHAGKSMGIVTFSTAQQNYIYDRLNEELRRNKLEGAAYECGEPLFVKNLENVQGDEREVILFSVGYGPDREGKLSLNFGPLNQANGYRRLNVAVTRARTEMRVFSSLRGNMIDLNRTDSRGVRCLKAFLEYAEKGSDMLVFDRKDVLSRRQGIGWEVAKELTERGIRCVYDLGVSDFRIDVAIVDPRDKNRYILAVICDGENERRIRSVRDRVALQTRILKTLGWNVCYLWTVNYLNNPKREIQKLKELVAKLAAVRTPGKKAVREALAKYRRPYRAANIKPAAKAGPDFVLAESNAAAIRKKAETIIETEQPVEEQYLLERLAFAYNVPKTSKRAMATLQSVLDGLTELRAAEDGIVYYRMKEPDFFRPLDGKVKRDFMMVSLGEIVSAVRCAAESNLPLELEELVKEVIALFGLPRKTKQVSDRIERAVAAAVNGCFVIRTVDGKYTV